MSNPSINRWGNNLLWYKLWYTDKNYAQTLHQDKALSELIFIFLYFGITHPNNIFINYFWYSSKIPKIQDYRLTHILKYYRQASFKNTITNEISYYSVRIKKRNAYPSKLWIFRYHSWLIINFSCYQPIIKKYHKNGTRKKRNPVKFFYLSNTKPSNYLIKRIKFIILYCLSKNISNFYNF